MNFATFMAENGKRVESYVIRFGKAFGVNGDILHDLRQEAHLAAYRALFYWREGSGHKSAFNWCAGPMRRAMEKSLRREYGLRPCGTEPIENRRDAYDDTRRYDENPTDLASTLDLRRILAQDPKPAQIMRLIMSALSPASPETFAASAGVSRQSVWASNLKAKARIRRALG